MKLSLVEPFVSRESPSEGPELIKDLIKSSIFVPKVSTEIKEESSENSEKDKKMRLFRWEDYRKQKEVGEKVLAIARSTIEFRALVLGRYLSQKDNIDDLRLVGNRYDIVVL